MKRKSNPAPPARRRRPKQDRSQKTYEAILIGAEQVAEALGDERFSVFTADKVAERAGVSIGTLYQYFADKKEILAEMLDRINRTDLQLVQDSFAKKAGESLSVKLEYALDRVIHERFQKHLGLYRFTILHRERIVRPETNRKVQEGIVQRFQELLEPHTRELGSLNTYHVSFLITRFFMNAMGSAVVLRPELMRDKDFLSLMKSWIISIPISVKSAPR